ncbi:MAG: hypothetical protein H7Z16_10985 [Pyrinomonadaceae bacterium]|nr:hypothetical protein [Pyrinomonadaceae bacterium]
MKLQRYLWIALTVSVLTTFMAVDVAAQDRPVWQGGVSFRDGTVIKMGVGIVPVGALDIGGVSPGTVVGMMAPNEAGVHLFIRMLKLGDGRVAIYQVSVKPLKEKRQFEVTLRSATPSPQQAKEWGLVGTRTESSFLRNYEKPIIVDNGDTLAIEVLGNPRTGVRLVDYFLISDHPIPEVESNRETLAKQARSLAMEDIELSVFSFDIRRNSKSIFKSEGGVRGRFIWLDVPGVGRFLFSLTQRSEDGGFVKAAYVTGQQISFSHGGDQYEVVTNQPIVHASGIYNLWMLFDPTFSSPTPNLFRQGDGFSVGAADDFPGVKGMTQKGGSSEISDEATSRLLELR